MRSCTRSWHLTAVALSGLVAIGACTSATEGGDTKPEPPAADEDAEVDPHRLCEVHTRVTDARTAGRLSALQDEFRAALDAAPGDRAAKFGLLLTEEPRKASWEAFRADGQANPGTVLLPLGECIIYAAWKMDDQAPPRCDAADDKLDNLALADVARADLARRKDHVDDALAAVDAAIDKDAACGAAYIVKARVLEDKGDTAAAMQAWAKGRNAYPKCFTCAISEAALVEDKDGVEAALPLWEAALQIVPDHAETLERYAAVQVGRDDAKALAAYEKALELGNEEFGTLMAAATLAEKTGAPLKAIDYAERAARIEPAHVDLWRLLARLYQSRDETEGFEKALEEILRLLPEDVAAHAELARLAEKAERYVDALEHYDAAAAAAATDESVEAALKEAVTAEHKALREKLMIAEPPASGSPYAVQSQVQRTVKTLYDSRKKSKGGKGSLTITVKTREDGTVETVNLVDDTLKDSVVAASLVGNLKRAKIDGGRKLYEFESHFNERGRARLTSGMMWRERAFAPDTNVHTSVRSMG